MIGNSYFRYFAKDHIAKLDQVHNFVKSCLSCIVLQLLTAELRKTDNFCNNYNSLIERVHTKWPNAVVIISLGIGRADSESLKKKLQESNILLQHK